MTISSEAAKSALEHATWLFEHARILRNVATDKAQRGLIVMAFTDIMEEVSRTEKRAQELLEFAAKYTDKPTGEGPYR